MGDEKWGSGNGQASRGNYDRLSMLTSEIFGPYAIMKEGITKDGFVNYYCWYPWMIEKKVVEENSPDGIELLKRENADLKDEIVRLKARLFDYMDKK